MRHRLPFPGSRVLAVALAVAVIAAGCSDGSADGEVDGDAASAATATEDATPVAATPTPEPTPEAVWPALGTAEVTTDDLNVRTGPGLEYLVLGRLQPGDEVPVSGRGTNGRWLALPGIGWVAYDAEWISLPVPLDELPLISVEESAFEFVGPLHPLDVVADIPVVDRVTEAVVQSDRTALLALAQPVPEDSEDSEQGEADGSADTPPNSACQDAVFPASELEAHIDDFLTSSTGAEGPLHLYAVVGVPATDDRDAEFWPIYAFERGEGRQLWLGPEGEIRWFSLGCEGSPPGDLLRVDRGEPFFWLRPIAPEPLDPVQ